jgi:hypothetical protein
MVVIDMSWYDPFQLAVAMVSCIGKPVGGWLAQDVTYLSLNTYLLLICYLQQRLDLPLQYMHITPSIVGCFMVACSQRLHC